MNASMCSFLWRIELQNKRKYLVRWKLEIKFRTNIYIYKLYNCFFNPKIQWGTTNSDQNFIVGIIFHFSQWGRNLRGFPPPETNFGLILFQWGGGLTGFVTPGCFKGVLNIELNTTSKREKQTLNKKIWYWCYFIIQKFFYILISFVCYLTFCCASAHQIKGGSRHKNWCMSWCESLKFLKKVFQ